ncbi:MAG: PfkB family carbohydrate kinase [Lutimonas sp.]
MGNLLIVGTVAFDDIETPFGKSDRILGGAATFIGLSASYFNTDSGIISVIGGDFPKTYLDIFKERNIDISGIDIQEEGKTFYWKGKYDYNLNDRETLITDLNVLADFNPVVPEKFMDCDFLMLGNLHPDVQMSVIEQIPVRPKLVVLDTMNFWMDNTLEQLMKVIEKVDVITINDEEARQLSGEYSLLKAAEKIHQMGPKYVVIKKGEHGALLFNNGDVFFAPALPLEEVFDPTGAGDTFAGGFIGYLASTHDISFDNMKRAVIYGSNFASFCVERFGVERMLNLTREEVRNRLRQFKQLTQFEIELTH